MTKRALILSPSAPPSGGSHATRVAALVETLTKNHFEIAIVTVQWSEAEKNGSKQFQRMAEIATVHEVGGGFLRSTARALGQMGGRPGRMQRFIQKLRAFTRSRLIPDTYATWIPNAVSLGQKLHREFPFDIVISSGAPFSSHIAGYAVSRRTKTPLALDYGDPWVYEPGRPRKGLRLLIERKLESVILNYASVASVTTQPTIDLYRDRYRSIDTPIVLAPMGFAQEDFCAPQEPQLHPEKERVLRLAYTGRINEEYRSVADLVKALGDVTPSHKSFCIDFFGSEFGLVRKELKEFEEMNLVQFFEPVDHPEYIKILRGYDGLIMFGNNNKVQIPGKLADYLAAEKNILYFPNIPDEDSDPTLLLARRIQENGVFVGRRRGEFDRFLGACSSGSPLQDKGELEKLDWQNCFEDITNSLINQTLRDG